MRWPRERRALFERRARQRPGLTSLVDVVFLLLIFFLLAGTLRARAPFDVELPEGAIGRVSPDGPASLWLAADGRLALGDETLPLPALVARLSSAESTPRDVRLHADARARARDLIPLLEALRRSGVGEIELIVRDPS